MIGARPAIGRSLLLVGGIIVLCHLTYDDVFVSSSSSAATVAVEEERVSSSSSRSSGLTVPSSSMPTVPWLTPTSRHQTTEEAAATATSSAAAVGKISKRSILTATADEILASNEALRVRVEAMEKEIAVLLVNRLIEGGATDDERETTLWNIWILFSAFNIMLMHLGFAMVETGLVAAHHTSDVLIKNLCDACFGTLGWYLTGYGLYSGDWLAVMRTDPSDLVDFIYSCSFATTATTILSGAIAGRANYLPYLIYSFLVCAIVYPVAAHCAWKGWLYELGFLDFAGDGPVHILGGTTSVVAAWTVGPRIGRFASSLSSSSPTSATAPVGSQANNGSGGSGGGGIRIRPASEGMLVLGTFILWFGWYSFNSSSSYSTTSDGMRLSKIAAANTVLSAASAGFVGFLWNLISTRFQVVEVGFICNSILIGLVSITGGCAYVSTYAALLIGALSVPVFVSCSAVLQRFEIDDPADATCVHLGGGFSGLIFTGLFHSQRGVLFCGSFSFLGVQAAGAAAMIVWSWFWATLFWGILGFIMTGEDNSYAGGSSLFNGGRLFGGFPSWLKGNVAGGKRGGGGGGGGGVSRWRMSEEDELCGMSYKVDVVLYSHGGAGPDESLDRSSIVMHHKVETAKRKIRASQNSRNESKRRETTTTTTITNAQSSGKSETSHGAGGSGPGGAGPMTAAMTVGQRLLKYLSVSKKTRTTSDNKLTPSSVKVTSSSARNDLSSRKTLEASSSPLAASIGATLKGTPTTDADKERSAINSVVVSGARGKSSHHHLLANKSSAGVKAGSVLPLPSNLDGVATEWKEMQRDASSYALVAQERNPSPSSLVVGTSSSASGEVEQDETTALVLRRFAGVGGDDDDTEVIALKPDT